MVKKDLIEIASKDYASPHDLIDTLFREMNLAMLRGEKIIIANFGAFEIREWNRTAYNFQEKKRMMVNKRRVFFVPSGAMKKLLNEKGINENNNVQ